MSMFAPSTAAFRAGLFIVGLLLPPVVSAAAIPYELRASLDFETGPGFAAADAPIFEEGTILTARFDYDPEASSDFEGSFGFPVTLSGYSQALSDVTVAVEGIELGATRAPALIGGDVPFPQPIGVPVEPFDLFFAVAGAGEIAGGWRGATLDGDRGRIVLVRLFLLASPDRFEDQALPATLSLEQFDHDGDPLLASCTGCGFWNGRVQRHLVLTVEDDDGGQQFAWFRIDTLSTADADGDGVVTDACPGTAPDEPVDARGCSVTQTCPCDGFRNHGQRLSCATRAVEELVQTGVLTGGERGAAVSAIARDRACR